MEELAARRDATMTVALCYLTAIMEGVDLQSMGIAAPTLRAELGLSPAQFGTAASMSLLGLLVGAIVGGRLADRYGRKLVLVMALLGLGGFTLLTTFVRNYHELLIVRLLVGLGLGGSFPILIALASEVAKAGKRATTISLMYAGVPMGTLIGTGMTLAFGMRFEWRWIFYVGGLGPLALAPVVLRLMPESAYFSRIAAAAKGARAAATTEVLFGQGRSRSTLLLWLSYAFTLLVIYLMTNWLNQLMSARGLDLRQSTTVLMAWGVGSIAGSVSLGLLSDTKASRWGAVLAYSGLAFSLFGLSHFVLFALLITSGFGAGFFAVGASLVNYALAPRYYPVAIRGTGVGWAVGIGRLGSIFGPLLGGLFLQAGLSASAVLVTFIPPLLIAATASSILLFGSAAQDSARVSS